MVTCNVKTHQTTNSAAWRESLHAAEYCWPWLLHKKDRQDIYWNATAMVKM